MRVCIFRHEADPTTSAGVENADWPKHVCRGNEEKPVSACVMKKGSALLEESYELAPA